MARFDFCFNFIKRNTQGQQNNSSNKDTLSTHRFQKPYLYKRIKTIISYERIEKKNPVLILSFLGNKYMYIRNITADGQFVLKAE